MRHEVNEFVARVSAELAERGHRVVIAAPSDSRARGARVAAGDRRGAERPGVAVRRRDGAARRRAGARARQRDPAAARARGRGRRRCRSTSAARSSACSAASSSTSSTSTTRSRPALASAALRHSRSLNVGSFHEPTERTLSTQVARPLVEIFLGRLDARTTSCGATEELMERFFPGPYERVEPGRRRRRRTLVAERGADATASGRLRIAFCLDEERGALRLFLRAIRRLQPADDWEAAVWVARRERGPGLAAAARPGPRRRPGDAAPEALIAGADVLVAASGGPRLGARTWCARRSRPGRSRSARSCRSTTSSPATASAGCCSSPATRSRSPASSSACSRAPALRRELAAQGARARSATGARSPTRSRRSTSGSAARRHDPRGNPEVRRRIARRREIHVDLHMHTDHSSDCATPVETLLATAREAGPRGDRDHRPQRDLGRARRRARSPTTSGSR